MNKLSNNLLKYLKKLNLKKYRDLENKFLIEGRDNIEQALKYYDWVEVYSSVPWDKAQYIVKQTEINAILKSKTPPNCFAVCKKITTNISEGSIVLLENIQDPGNLGTIMRNCVAFGVKNLIVQGVDIYNDKVLRSSKGAFFNLNVVQVDSAVKYVQNFKENHLIIGTSLSKKSKNISEYKSEKKWLLIFGNESKGLSKEMNDLLINFAYIPINYESLNVAVANAIALYELTRKV